MNDTYLSHVRGIWLGLIIAVVYIVTAWIGLHIHPVNTFATLIWPPTGIALSALVLFGYRVWPAIAIGAFVANFMVGGSILVALGISVGNTFEALLGAFILRDLIGF